MSININLDGVFPFIVALALCLFFLLALVFCALYGCVKARQTKESFTHQPMFSSLVGMLLSLLCGVLILLLLLSADGTPRSQPLDLWFGIWAVAIMALWPVSAYAWKRRQRSKLMTGNGAT
jgi:L-asparagine transporter-like permease